LAVRKKHQKTTVMKRIVRCLGSEAGLFVGVFSAALFFAFGKAWLADLGNLWWAAGLFCWLFTVILSTSPVRTPISPCSCRWLYSL
jgi:hypothetical protein